MWSVQLSERRKQQSFFLIWLAALNISFMLGRNQNKFLQSCPVVVRFAEGLDAALYLQCLRSCNRGGSEDQSINTTAEGGALQHPLATVRIKTMFRNVQFHLVLSLNSSGEGSWIRHFHSTIAWFKTAHETNDLWWTTSMQRNLCNHGIIRRFGHSQNVSWYVQEAKSGCVDIRLYKIIPRNSQLGARMHFYTASVMCLRRRWWRWSPSAKQVLAQFVHELINSHLITTVLQKCLTSAGHLLCCSCTCDLVTGCNTKSDTSAQPALCF